MTYEVIILGHLHMPLYFLGTFTEYPYTLGMMKRQENKQRFYLWDYLWWMGEKWKQARRTGRVDGEMMLSIYIFALLIFPMMTVTIRLNPCVLLSAGRSFRQIQ